MSSLNLTQEYEDLPALKCCLIEGQFQGILITHFFAHLHIPPRLKENFQFSGKPRILRYRP